MKKRTEKKQATQAGGALVELEDFINFCLNSLAVFERAHIMQCGVASSVVFSLSKAAKIKAQIAECKVIDPDIKSTLGNGHYVVLLENEWLFDLTLRQFFPTSAWPVCIPIDSDATRDIYGKLKILTEPQARKLVCAIGKERDTFTPLYLKSYNDLQAFLRGDIKLAPKQKNRKKAS